MQRNGVNFLHSLLCVHEGVGHHARRGLVQSPFRRQYARAGLAGGIRHLAAVHRQAVITVTKVLDGSQTADDVYLTLVISTFNRQTAQIIHRADGSAQRTVYHGNSIRREEGYRFCEGDEQLIHAGVETAVGMTFHVLHSHTLRCMCPSHLCAGTIPGVAVDVFHAAVEHLQHIQALILRELCQVRQAQRLIIHPFPGEPGQVDVFILELQSDVLQAEGGGVDGLIEGDGERIQSFTHRGLVLNAGDGFHTRSLFIHRAVRDGEIHITGLRELRHPVQARNIACGAFHGKHPVRLPEHGGIQLHSTHRDTLDAIITHPGVVDSEIVPSLSSIHGQGDGVAAHTQRTGAALYFLNAVHIHIAAISKIQTIGHIKNIILIIDQEVRFTIGIRIHAASQLVRRNRLNK